MSLHIEQRESEGIVILDLKGPLTLGHGDLDLRDDRKSTRLNSSHLGISYAVFCLKNTPPTDNSPPPPPPPLHRTNGGKTGRFFFYEQNPPFLGGWDCALRQ